MFLITSIATSNVAYSLKVLGHHLQEEDWKYIPEKMLLNEWLTSVEEKKGEDFYYGRVTVHVVPFLINVIVFG